MQPKPPVVRRYSYPNLTRHDGEIRHYTHDDAPEVYLPSVTTILSGTEPPEKTQALQQWRDRIGNRKADEIVKYACSVGTLMHENLENYVDDKPFHHGSMPMRVQARDMANVIIDNSHGRIDEVWGQEVELFYPTLWAGTTDLVGVFEGEPAIMDYKNSRNFIKDNSSKTETFKLQGAAYALAHEKLFGFPIDQAAFFCCVRKDPKNLKYQEFIFRGEEFQEAKMKWIERVDQYHAKKN